MSNLSRRIIVLLCSLFWSCSDGADRARIDLNGRWQIAFNDSLEFKDTVFQNGKFEDITVPSNWGSVREYSGVAWYQKAFQIPPGFDRNNRAFSFVVYDADETFVNGQLIGASGSMQDPTLPAYNRNRIYPIPPDLLKEGTNLLSVRIRPLSDQNAGITERVQIADLFDLERERLLSELRQLCMGTIYLAVGLYFFLFFLRLRSMRANLYFGLFCVMLALYLLLRVPWISDSLGFLSAKRIEYIVLFCLPIPFLAFWNRMFELPLNKALPLYYIIFAAFTYFPLSSDVIPLWSKMLGFWYIPLLPAIPVVLFTIFRSIADGNKTGWVLLAGTFIFSTAIVNDILADRGLIFTPGLLDVGFLAFVTAMAISLIRSFVALQREAEMTLVRLTEMDQLKERLVTNVTEMLIAPAGTIFTTAESLAAKATVPQSEYARMFEDGAELNEALDNVLLLSRIQSGIEKESMRAIGAQELGKIFRTIEFPAEASVLGTDALLRALLNSISKRRHFIRYQKGTGLTIRVLEQPRGTDPSLDGTVQQAVIGTLGGNIFHERESGRLISIPEIKVEKPWTIGSTVGFKRTAVVRPIWSAIAMTTYLILAQPILAALQAVHLLWSSLLLLRAWSKNSSRGSTSERFARSALDVALIVIGAYASGGIDSPTILLLALPVVLSSLGDNKWRGLFSGGLGALGVVVSEILTSTGIVPDLNVLGKGNTPTELWQIGVTGLMILGGLLSLAVITNKLFVSQMAAREEAERERRKSEKANEFSRELNVTTDFSSLIERIVAYLQNEFKIDSLILLLPDGESPDLVSTRVFTKAFLEERVMNAAQSIRIPPAPNGGLIRTVFERKKPMYVRVGGSKDIFKRPYPGIERDRELVEAAGFDWFLLFPMVVQGKGIGIVLCTSYEHPEGLGREELTAAYGFLDQVAGALHGANVLNQINREKDRAQELSKEAEKARNEYAELNEFAKLVNSTPSLSRIFDEIFDRLNKATNIDSVWIGLADKSESYVQSYWFKQPGETTGEQVEFFTQMRIRLDSSGGTQAQTFARKVPLLVPDLSKITGRNIVNPLDGADYHISRLDVAIQNVGGVRGGFMQIPLVLDERVIGLLNVARHSRPLDLNKDEIRRLLALSDQMTGAIHNAILMEEVKARGRAADQAKADFQALADLSRKASQNPEIVSIVESVHAFCNSRFGIEFTALYLVSPDGKALEVRHVADFSRAILGAEREQTFKSLRIPIEPTTGSLYRTYKKQTVFYLKKVKRSWLRSEFDREIVDTLQFEWFAQVPLLAEGKTIGILALTSWKQARLSSADLELLQAMADQVAGTVRGAQQLKEITSSREIADRQRRGTQKLNEIAKALNASPDLRQISQRILDHLREEHSVESSILLLPDAEGALVPHIVLGRQDRIEIGLSARIPTGPDGGLVRRAFERKKPLFVKIGGSRDIFRVPYPGMERDRSLIERLGLQWFLLLPLIVQDKSIGMLMCTSYEEKSEGLSTQDIKDIGAFADQIAGALYASNLLAEVERARIESDRLLGNILPATIAQELKERGTVEPLFYDSVSVLFTDFVGFTKASENLLPDELVTELDGCFSQFDAVVTRNKMEKLKTIGDSYMCAAGLPEIRSTHAIDACLTALEFRDFMLTAQRIKESLGIEFWQVRIGIHSGPVTAGVIGTNKFAYDIWGDTVNTASRMESSSEPGKVNISGETYNLVKDFFECQYRGKVKAKGKGDIDMYFLERIKPELSADEVGLLPNAKFEFMRSDLESA
ncbi:MAG: GAF domain-containing protein [Leptospirales bacterium]|nr:GAF domain-containing protein [Leptospirales bacterium]